MTMASAHLMEFNDDNWTSEVVESKIPVVVDFWAPWCGPCRQLTPTIEILATKYAGKVKIGKLNVDDAQQIAAQYRVTNIPRVLIFKGGADPRETFVGVKHEAEYTKAIDSILQEK
jgi:thioredoxin 1